MKLLYLTAIEYPSPTANAHQTKSMSRAFQKYLNDNFLLIVDKSGKQALKNINFYEMDCPFFKLRTLYYFYYFLAGKIPFLDKQTIIYTKDPQLIVVANLFKKKYGYKTCFELHIPWKSKIKRIIWKTDLFVVLNKYLRQILVKNYKISLEKIFIFPDAVNIDKFNIKRSKRKCRAILNLPQKKKLAGYIGRFKTSGKEKGIRAILETIPLINRDILYCFVGGNKKEIKEYQDLAIKIGVLEKCIFVPFQPLEKLPFYMKAMDLLLMSFPKAEHYEYFMSPLKMFEYMTSKRPIIASDLPSIREILNKKNAILVKPNNPEALARGIKQLLSGSRLIKQIYEQAYKDVQNYTWDKRAKKILNFIHHEIEK